MKVEDFEKEFLAMPEKEQMANMISVMGIMMGRKGGGCCG